MKALAILAIVLVCVLGLAGLALGTIVSAIAPVAWFVKELVRPTKPELSA